MTRSWRLWRVPLLIVTALLVPVAILGLAFEDRIQEWVTGEWQPSTRFWVIVLILGADILLPVPSSGVSTFAGGSLGLKWGACASWLGMTGGGLGGFLLARWLGRTFVQRNRPDDLAGIDEYVGRYGVATLLLTRPLPLLAEACVLVCGSSEMPVMTFLAATGFSNLVISVAYAAAGAYSKQYDVLPPVIIASVLLPMGIAIAVRALLRKRANSPKATSNASDE